MLGTHAAFLGSTIRANLAIAMGECPLFGVVATKVGSHSVVAGVGGVDPEQLPRAPCTHSLSRHSIIYAPRSAPSYTLRRKCTLS